jgi:hypothetical protein
LEELAKNDMMRVDKPQENGQEASFGSLDR